MNRSSFLPRDWDDGYQMMSKSSIDLKFDLRLYNFMQGLFDEGGLESGAFGALRLREAASHRSKWIFY